MNSKLITGIQTLKDHHQQWNSLWARTTVAYPGNRAENIALWMKQFQPNDSFHAATVWKQDRLVAALPLVEKKKAGVRMWSTTNNCWAFSGDLLLDETESAETLCRQLVDALDGGNWNLLKLDGIACDSPRWQSFQAALNSANLGLRKSAGESIALTDVLQDWPAYQASWSGNHRHAIKKGIKRLSALGDLHAECFDEGSTSELEKLLRDCFTLEDRTWKGENGTSIIKSGMQDYFLNEARNLLASNSLHLWQLKLDEKLIAFEYCAVAKGVVFSNKISFDPEYSRYSPGNALRFFQHEHYQQDEQTRLFDMMGITCMNKAKWATRSYQTANVIAAKGLVGNFALKVAALLKPARDEAPPIPPLGASRYLETAGSSYSLV